MEKSKHWIDKDEWDLEVAWVAWKTATFPCHPDKAKHGEAYEEYIKVLNRIKDKKDD